MIYKNNYFEGGFKYDQKNFLYFLKRMFFSNKRTDTHYNLILLDRWKNFKDCQKILDVGCGLCEFLKFNPYSKDVVGVDFIMEIVLEHQKNGFPVKFGDLNKKLPYKKNSFDGIILSHVLEHLDDPTNALIEIKRLLKENGKLVIIVPNYSFKKFYSDYTHKRPYPKIALFRLLEAHNFLNIKIKNGPCLNQGISLLFFIFPKIRFLIEKIIGEFFPSEFVAVAEK